MRDDKPVILTIAGFDPSAGAGITADLKTAAAHDVYAVACITALTVQTTQGVSRTHAIPPEVVRETLDALVEDTPPSATKIGMLGSSEVARTIAQFLRVTSLPHVVLDPVLHSSSGADLLDTEGMSVLREELLGLAEVVTPNLDEASFLTGTQVRGEPDMESAARQLHALGARNVVITGGHLSRPVDLLSQSRQEGGLVFQLYSGQKVEAANTHGTGCAFSTAMACNLAVGIELSDAVRRAKEYVADALRNSYSIGKGPGPVNHLFRFKNE